VLFFPLSNASLRKLTNKAHLVKLWSLRQVNSIIYLFEDQRVLRVHCLAAVVGEHGVEKLDDQLGSALFVACDCHAPFGVVQGSPYGEQGVVDGPKVVHQGPVVDEGFLELVPVGILAAAAPPCFDRGLAESVIGLDNGSVVHLPDDGVLDLPLQAVVVHGETSDDHVLLPGDALVVLFGI
jgi:hypothetical protein